jgi:uncharacterized protein YjiS (DUF1127 family)
MTIFDNPIAREFHANGRRVHGTDLLGAIAGSLASAITALLDWQDRVRERRQLAGLSDRALMDFGASLSDADREGAKPFWQA